MTRPTEKQLAEVAMRWAEALIEHYFNEHHMAFREALDKLDAAVKAYRSAQQAEAVAAGGVPPLPVPDLCGTKSHYLQGGFSKQAALAYGQQCYEAGRQQGMEQASPCEAAAVKTLVGMRFTWDGGEQWKPATSSAQEPTDAMKEAGAREILLAEKPAATWEEKAGRVFMAMIAAAPARLAGAAQGEADPICTSSITAARLKDALSNNRPLNTDQRAVLFSMITEADTLSQKFDAEVERAVAAERARCVRVCRDEAAMRRSAGDMHDEDSESRSRCMAGARAALNCAVGCESGEVV